MKNIIAIAGSNSSKSINKQFVKFIASQYPDINYLNLENFEPPMYSSDLENDYGTHQKIKDLVAKFQAADAVIVSTPEHNSMPPAFFKNILDWLSRTGATYLEGAKYLQDKPVLLASVSPGKGGAASSQALVGKMLGYGGAKIVSNLTVGGFYDSFENDKVVNEALIQEIENAISDLKAAID
ncbi:MAG: NAD(P)H-dependent oxidoreductase [Crocinitomicaceae bacterium]